ncbi:hypothetical protein G6F65_019756 [Rhizopus arrhizus]|nr:hypothetical protein G6F65_019756 [Rhizopus arrhizus]
MRGQLVAVKADALAKAWQHLQYAFQGPIAGPVRQRTHAQVLTHGQVGKNAAGIRYQCDAVAADLLDRAPCGILAAIAPASLRQRQQSDQCLEKGGLAGAVASDDGDDLVLSRAQRDVFQRKCLAVMHLGMQQFDHAATSSPR